MANEIDDLNAEIERLQQEAIEERDEIETDDLSVDEDTSSENDVDSDDNKTIDEDNDEEENSDGSQEEQEAEEENSIEDDSEQRKADTPEFEPLEVVVDNTKIQLNSNDEVKKFIANQNRNIPKVESEIEETFNQAGLSISDLELLADIKAGKVGALKELAKNNKLDLADAEDFSGEYLPEFKATHKTDVERVVDNISSNTELVDKFTDIVSELPKDFIDIVSSNAGDLQQFAQHVDSGLAQELLPLAKKASVLNGGSVLENYIKLGEEKAFKDKNVKTNEPEKEITPKKRGISEKEKRLRQRAGADIDDNSSKSDGNLSVDDIWNMKPEDLKKINLREL